MATELSNILAVSWAMPPLLMPRSIQVSRGLKGLAGLGWNPTVLCVHPHSIKNSITLDASLAQVYLRGFEVLALHSPPWSRVLDFFFPMEQYFWGKKTVREGRGLFRARKFAAVLSFAQPWVDHFVALELRRSINFPWVAHFSDPWVDSPYLTGSGWRLKVWRQMEEDVIREADAVVFVNTQTADMVMRNYPEAWREKVRVVPHAYDSELIQSLHLPRESRESCRSLRLVYTGSFYPGKRTPVSLLAGLQLLNQNRPLAGRLEVALVGPNSELYRPAVQAMGLGEVVRCSGPVSYMESLQDAARADVLLLIDKASDGPSLFLPSKLVDYLAFGKPILGLTPLAGASADLLRRLDCPMAPPDYPAAIAEAVAGLLDKWEAGGLAVSPNFTKVAWEYDSRQTTARLDNILQAVIHGKR